MDVNRTGDEVVISRRAETDRVFSHEIVPSGDGPPSCGRDGTRDHLDAGEVVNVDDSGSVLRVAERSK